MLPAWYRIVLIWRKKVTRKVLAKEKRKEWLRKLVAAVKLPEREAAARRIHWSRLRGDVWLRYVMLQTKWSWQDLKDELRKNRARSELVEKWRAGEVNPSRVSAQKIEEHAPGSLALFDLPMWGLLGTGPKTEREIERLLKKAEDSGPLPDQIDATIGMDNAYRGAYPEALYGPLSLVMDRSLASFNRLIVLTREAEAGFDDRRHAQLIESLYLLFPTIAKFPYFAPSTIGLAQAISDLHGRVEWSRASFGVDWNVLHAAIDSPDDESEREKLLLSWIRPNGSCAASPIRRSKIGRAPDIGNPSSAVGNPIDMGDR